MVNHGLYFLSSYDHCHLPGRLNCLSDCIRLQWYLNMICRLESKFFPHRSYSHRPVDLRGAATSSEPQPIHVKDFLDYTGRCLRPNDPTLDHQYAVSHDGYDHLSLV